MNQNQSIEPPKLLTTILRWFCRPQLIEDVEGDLSELFAERATESLVNARIRYFLDVLFLFRPGIIKNIELKNGLINIAMIKNYLKIALRNALRYKGFTTLNLLGLIVGITTSSIIFLWVHDEVSMDKFHTNGDRIYQLFRNMRQSGGMVQTTFTIPKPAADMMKEEYPELDEIALFSWPMDADFTNESSTIVYQGNFASPEFLRLFTFPLLERDESSVLSGLDDIVISRKVAESYFGSEWRGKAIGQLIEVNEHKVRISGVFENTPENSTFQFDWLMPAQSFVNSNAWVDNWGNGSFAVYFTLKDEGKAGVVQDRVLNIIKENASGNDLAGDEQIILHKFQDYYLYSNFTNGVVDGGRITYVRMLSVVAILILIIASINFMNLATARSSRRSKEIGLRKVMGAYKSSISAQFLMESILLTTFAVLISALVIWLILPYFNQLVNKQLTIDFTLSITWIYAVGIALIVGLLSGSYPALLLSAYGIINSLKGSAKKSSSGVVLRKILVVFQFGISVLLIIGVSVVYSQLDYALTKDLGLNKDNLISVELDSELDNQWQTVKTEISKFPNVTAVTVASGNPLTFNRSTSSANWEGKDPSEGYEINIMLTDESFIETTEIEVIKGRDFSSQFQDSTSFLINEVAAELMGFDDPIDKKLSFWDIEGRIIGVIKNYHMQDMHEAISPLIISCINPAYSDVVLIRVDGSHGEVLKSTEDLLKSMSPIYDFNYEFVDEAYAESYETEFLISKMIQIFAGISIFLSCLGLFGLSAFTAEQRTKEIGIRKVHGASIKQLALLLSKDYAKLMIIAFILTIPVGYYYSQQWLGNFEFRTTIKPMLFVISGGLVFIVGALTVSFKSFTAAKMNPVDTLKDE